jgi:hypothetical protein
MTFADAFCNPAGNTCRDASFITQVPARSLDSTLLQPSIPNSKKAIWQHVHHSFLRHKEMLPSKLVVSKGAKPTPFRATVWQQIASAGTGRAPNSPPPVTPPSTRVRLKRQPQAASSVSNVTCTGDCILSESTTILVALSARPAHFNVRGGKSRRCLSASQKRLAA